MPTLAKIIAEEKPRMLIAVGDAVSNGMRLHGLSADLYVVDRKIMRRKIGETISASRSITVHNPPGVISKEAFEGLKKAITEGNIDVVYVDGEEDLLALPSILLAPLGSIIVYGQPLVGLVVIRVNVSTKREATGLLSKMKVLEKVKV
jgi:uncharacterized protein (UPF0218 family)